ncbi:hypothetical protein GCM10010435_92320 [Winogradskya consettensis]|uniref:Uncharacterized protein n=1 Tax=Winogradskya consettensis TaxID=113560 RepID=A0A919W5V6_9ACTN|nr:hypothetical protein [Actinoplanes consettensis]GIM81292.1 hypothetical protein Aco04nite_75840 [Actinoplanes consettensis]
MPVHAIWFEGSFVSSELNPKDLDVTSAEELLARMQRRLHGQGIAGHAIGVEEAIRILSPLQQALSSIGQSLATMPTASGKIPEVRCGDDAEETVVRHLTKGHGDQAPSARRHSTRRQIGPEPFARLTRASKGGPGGGRLRGPAAGLRLVVMAASGLVLPGLARSRYAGFSGPGLFRCGFRAVDR